MATYTTQEYYEHRLYVDLGKLYQLPFSRSAESKMLSTRIHHLFTLKDRSSLIAEMQLLLASLVRLPEKVTGRADERVLTIAKLLGDFRPTSILDIGAGTADITTALMHHYHLPSDRVFAIDQKLPTGVEVTPLTYVEGKIPLPDHSMDLIILFAVLHHVPPEHRHNLLQEISRVLAPHGYVIIREHDDTKDPNFFMYLDLYHILWYLAKNETADPLYLLSRSETQSLFASAGLTSVKFQTYPETVPNPKRMYHEMFKKIAPVYRFADPSAQIYLQTYINSIKPYKSFEVLPSSLRDMFRQKYLISDTTWPLILKELTLQLILTAIKYIIPIDGIYYLTTDALSRALSEL